MRDIKGRFKPGTSGNPSGRPKGIMAYTRELTQDGKTLIDFWIDILNGKEVHGFKPDLDDMKDAARELANRGFGKAVQHQYIETESANTEEPDLSKLSDEELQKLADLLSKAGAGAA